MFKLKKLCLAALILLMGCFLYGNSTSIKTIDFTNPNNSSKLHITSELLLNENSSFNNEEIIISSDTTLGQTQMLTGISPLLVAFLILIIISAILTKKKKGNKLIIFLIFFIFFGGMFFACGDEEVLGLFLKEKNPQLKLTVLNPTNNQLINTNVLLVSGNIIDEIGNGIQGIYFSLDGGLFNPVADITNWSTNLLSISYGAHSFRVYAIDNLANYSLTNLVNFIAILYPIISVTAPTNTQNFTNNSVIASGTALDNSGSGLKGVYLSLDGGPYNQVGGTNSWSTNLDAPATGAHNIRVYAIDNFTNYTITNLINYTISVNPRVAYATPLSNQMISNSFLSITGTATDIAGSGLEGVYLSLDGGIYNKVSGTTSWTTNLNFTVTSNHNLQVYSRDNTANYSLTNYRAFSVNVNPLLTMASPTNNETVVSNTVTVNGTATDNSTTGLEGVYLSLDGEPYNQVNGTTSWTSNLDFTNSASHNLRIYTRDNGVNYSITNQINFNVDVNPLISVTTPVDSQTIYSNSFTMTGTASDYSGTGLGGVYVSLDAGPFNAVSGTTSWSSNFSSLADSSYTLRSYALDNAGNYSTTNQISITILEDITPPTISITSHANAEVISNSPFTLSGTAADVGTGVDSVYLSIDGADFASVSGTTSWSSNISDLSNGHHILRVYAIDGLTNYSTTNQITIEMADYGPYAGMFTIVVANGNNLRISTNGYNNFYSIYDVDKLIVGCTVDRYRNIYVVATNDGGDNTSSYGTVRDFTGSVSYDGISGNVTGICANDDYGHFYSYEISGTALGGIFSSDYGSNFAWVGEAIVGQSGVGVCYVAANPAGYVVLGRNDGTLSVRSGGSGLFSEVNPAGNTYGAHQIALTTNMPPTIAFIHEDVNLRSSDDGYTVHNIGKNITSLRYHGQRLWFGFDDGTVDYSDDHGQSMAGINSGPGVAEAITAIAVDSLGRIFVGTAEGKLYVSLDNASNWEVIIANWGSYISQIHVMDK